jgi:hypothetical protein
MNSNKPVAFWTLQQYDEINGKPWCALLEQHAIGVRRGWTGYRPKLEELARMLKITPEELPPTTSREFFLRTNMFALRPLVPRDRDDPLPTGSKTLHLRRGPLDDDHSD